MKPEYLNGIYRDIAENIGIDVALKIYENYKGLQLTFPLKFLSSQYVNNAIIQEFNGTNTRELARKFSCSERKVRNVLRDNNLTK